MTITNMQQPMQMQRGLGSLQDPRQNYGLGSFVKKAIRGVKKIVKSPLGKAAIIGGLGYGLGGGFGIGGAKTPGFSWGNMASRLGLGSFNKGLDIENPNEMKNIGMFGKMKGMWNKLTPGQKIFTGGSAFALGAPLVQNMFAKGKDVVEEVDEDYIDPYTAYMMAKFKNPQMNFLPENRFTNNYYQTAVPAANGGRIGYADGMMVEEEDIDIGIPTFMKRRGYQGGGRMNFQGGGADMGDPGKAQERADRGYGNTSGPDDRSNMEQQMNHYNAIEDAKDYSYETNQYPPGSEGYEIERMKYGPSISPFVSQSEEVRNYLRQQTLDAEEENKKQVNLMDFQTIPDMETKLGDRLYDNYVDVLPPAFNFNKPEKQMAALEKLDDRQYDELENRISATMGTIGDDSMGYPDVSPHKLSGILKGIDNPYSLDRNQIQKYYYANGGRTGYQGGELVEQESVEEIQLPDQAEQMLQMEYQKYVEGGGQLPYPEFKKLVLQQMREESQQPEVQETIVAENVQQEAPAQGIAQLAAGGMAEQGMIDMGGMEKDYRAEGGFVPLGGEEKADDVPARLSKNEFVFTADAVRNAGGGDIDAGAEVMENMMNNLEQGGQVSEDSQGLEGAQQMYDQQQILQSRMA